MRISWSPDGTYLIAGSAVNNGGPTAQAMVGNQHSETEPNLRVFQKIQQIRDKNLKKMNPALSIVRCDKNKN